MRAIVWTRYGPPEGLQLREVPAPAPKDNEILIRVRATTVTAGDCEMRALKAVVDRCFPLAQTAEVHRYVETGQKVGNVAVTVASPMETEA